MNNQVPERPPRVGAGTDCCFSRIQSLLVTFQCCLTCKTQICLEDSYPYLISVAESEVNTIKINQVEKEMNQSEAGSSHHPGACLLHSVYLQDMQKAWTHWTCTVTLRHHKVQHVRRAALTLNITSVRGNPLVKSRFVPVTVRNQRVLPHKVFLLSITQLWLKKGLRIKPEDALALNLWFVLF